MTCCFFSANTTGSFNRRCLSCNLSCGYVSGSFSPDANYFLLNCKGLMLFLCKTSVNILKIFFFNSEVFFTRIIYFTHRDFKSSLCWRVTSYEPNQLAVGESKHCKLGFEANTDLKIGQKYKITYLTALKKRMNYEWISWIISNDQIKLKTIMFASIVRFSYVV